MPLRSHPIFIPDRAPRAQQTEMGHSSQANGYPGRLKVGRSDQGISPTLNQDPPTPDIDKVYGSVSPLISTFGSSLPEPSWTDFDVNRMLYSANNSPESSFRFGRSGNTVADEALRTIDNVMPHSTPFMSQDIALSRTFAGSQSAPSALISPGHPLPINAEYVHSGNVLTSHPFCLPDSLYQVRPSGPHLWLDRLLLRRGVFPKGKPMATHPGPASPKGSEMFDVPRDLWAQGQI
ncbi:hypothetical protein PEBR_12044 [Penicillium brasilianum]|uniref:Uncharacterized protein n=1 Tax=Penicillium brasilianum TaxID=104259 RepID=A0A1S9RSR4_PENBI|nr:hypothetical protein PEBR_12044 [Penicillium brasilianum]